MEKEGFYMKHLIDLSRLQSQGATELSFADGVLNMTVTRAIHTCGYNFNRNKIGSYASLPGAYRLPLCIDLYARADIPAIFLLLGDGQISIGSPWMENHRIDDPLLPKGKPRMYDNHIPFDKPFHASVFLGASEMQILINGEERFYSNREPYMKALRTGKAENGLIPIAITCTKHSALRVLGITVTELEGGAALNRTGPAPQDSYIPLTPLTEKPSFEGCIQELPTEIQQEIRDTELFLKALPHIKWRRTLEKHGNKITYVASALGVSYAVYVGGGVMHHSLQYYLVANSAPDQWHRRGNSLEKVLDFLRSTNPPLAARIWGHLNECIGCFPQCLARSPYQFQSEKKLSCHGQVVFHMRPADFQDVRDFFSAVNTLLAESAH